MRSLKVDTAAASPVYTTAQMKTFLKVDVSDDDTLIDNLIEAATESCQIYTNQYFINTVVTQYSDNWKEFYSLYKSPVVSITHVKYYDSDDAQQTDSNRTSSRHTSILEFTICPKTWSKRSWDSRQQSQRTSSKRRGSRKC